MRIVIAVKQFGGFGGVARSSARLARALTARGHDVVVSTLDEDLFGGEERECDGVHAIGVATSDQLAPWSRQIARLAENADVVLGFYASWGGAAAVLAGAQCQTPAVVALRGNDVDRDPYHAATLPFVELAVSRAAAVTAVSSQMARTARTLFGRDVTFVSNSVDRAQFRADPSGARELRAQLELDNRPVLGIFGELKQKRGLDRLVPLADMLDDFQLLIVGRVRPQVRSHVPAQARVLGPIASTQELCAAYTLCDAVLQPSHHDGMPNVVLEAMACGRAVLASPVGGMLDLIEHDVNGWLCADETAWREALGRVAAGGAQRLGDHAAQHLPTPDDEAARFEQILTDAMERHAAM